MVRIREAHSLLHSLPDTAAGVLEAIGSPHLRAALDILEILALLGLDDESLVAGLFCVPMLEAGVDNLLTQFAGCCRPLPGDAISGYVTSGRGVSVHRADCSKLLSLARSAPARIMELAWQGEQPRLHAVAVKVVAQDRPGLLRDLVNLLGNERINVLDLGTTVDRHRRLANVRLTIEIGSLGALGRVLERIRRIDGVLSAVRHLE